MKNAMIAKLVGIYLFSTLFFFGFGFPLFQRIASYVFIVIPMVVVLYIGIKKKVSVPKKITLVYLLFLLFSCISVLLAPVKEEALLFVIIYISGFSLFLLSNNLREISLYLPKVIYSIAILACLYALLLQFWQVASLVPHDGYQFVYAKFGSHNNLGDFLLLPLIYSSYSLLQRFSAKHLLAILFFLPFFIFSYSRSAYLDFLIVLAVMFFISTERKNHSPVPIVILLSLIGIVVFVFFHITAVINPAVPNSETTILQQQYDLKYKNFLGERNIYYQEAVTTIIRNPLGIGPGNFSRASGMYGPSGETVIGTSHNIFLDVFAENGILAGVMFVIFVMFIFTKSKKDVYFFLFLALLLNFQTYYLYRISAVLFLLFIVLGLIYEEDLKLIRKR